MHTAAWLFKIDWADRTTTYPVMIDWQTYYVDPNRVPELHLTCGPCLLYTGELEKPDTRSAAEVTGWPWTAAIM